MPAQLLTNKGGLLRWAVTFVAGVVVSAADWPMALSAVENPSGRLSVAELQTLVSEHARTIQSFQLTGVVCAVLEDRKLVALQDHSAAALLELPALDQVVQAGDCLLIEGRDCSLQRARYAIRVGAELTVDNDGVHGTLSKSGTTLLNKGMQPLHLEWFNGGGPFALRLEYEGPEFSRQKIPDSVLWHGACQVPGVTNFQQGLNFAAYIGQAWYLLPDFKRVRPVREGIATNINLAYRARNDNSGLVFNGYLQNEKEGLYTFHLDSDDGSRLIVGQPGAGCQVTRLETRSAPVVRSLEQAALEQPHAQWIETEGTVSLVGVDENGLQLELVHARNPVQVTVLDGLPLLATNPLGQHIRVTGLCEFPPVSDDARGVRMIVPTAAQVHLGDAVSSVEHSASADTALRTAAQIRSLKPEKARQSRLAVLKGVVTWRSPTALVLQDASAGIFILYHASDQSREVSVGDFLELRGTTDRGDWSPIIRAREISFLGHAPMPEPLHPTWDQLMNGSLDAQYVEIRGVLAKASSQELTLLTQDGSVKILSSDERPLPSLPSTGTDNYLDSVVRIRGCLTPQIDWSTFQNKAGEVFINPAIVSVEEPTPPDPFSLPTRKASELLLFDPAASALQRTKVAGEIIHARPGEFFALDDQIGFRVLTPHPIALEPGDLVEVVGFPQPGGPAPILQEARVRKTGHAPLPAPVRLRSEELLERKHDSTLVQIEAVLVSDTVQQGERILELQSGPYRFLARLNARRENWSLPAGSRLQLTGVHASPRDDRASLPLAGFELLLNQRAAITVLERPPWWTVRRALIIAGALAAALGLAFFWVTLLRRKVEARTAELQKEIEERQRVEHRHIVEQERTRVAQDLHDELGAGLTEMGLLGALARNPAVPNQEKEAYLDKLIESARALVTGLDEIVWAINPHYDSVGSLATYYSLFAERFLNLAGITCRLEVPESFPEYPLDSRVRHGVFLAFKEALNNVVRHSGATEVELKIQMIENELAISIRDNGRGIEATSITAGRDGMVGMRERLNHLAGRCQICSQPGQGTTVDFRLAVNGNGS